MAPGRQASTPLCPAARASRQASRQGQAVPHSPGGRGVRGRPTAGHGPWGAPQQPRHHHRPVPPLTDAVAEPAVAEPRPPVLEGGRAGLGRGRRLGQDGVRRGAGYGAGRGAVHGAVGGAGARSGPRAGAAAAAGLWVPRSPGGGVGRPRPLRGLWVEPDPAPPPRGVSPPPHPPPWVAPPLPTAQATLRGISGSLFPAVGPGPPRAVGLRTPLRAPRGRWGVWRGAAPHCAAGRGGAEGGRGHPGGWGLPPPPEPHSTGAAAPRGAGGGPWRRGAGGTPRRGSGRRRCRGSCGSGRCCCRRSRWPRCRGSVQPQCRGSGQRRQCGSGQS